MSEHTGDKAHAWTEVWKQLKEGNPTFFEHGETGLESALIEIRRLQANDVLVYKLKTLIEEGSK